MVMPTAHAQSDAAELLAVCSRRARKLASHTSRPPTHAPSPKSGSSASRLAYATTCTTKAAEKMSTDRGPVSRRMGASRS